MNWKGHTASTFQEIVGWWDPSVTSVSSRMFLGVAQGVQGPMRYGDDWTNVQINLQQNEWVHLLATYDGTTNNRNVYLNGVLADSLSNSAVAMFANLSIGRQGSGSEYWNGAIDELALYSRVLDQNEITSLAMRPSAVPIPSAIWLFGSCLIGLFGMRNDRTADQM